MKYNGWGTRAPYIGVTGVIKGEQAEALADLIPEGSGYILMAGILVSSKTKAGLLNKYPGIYPPMEKVGGALEVKRKNVTRIIHYNTDQPENLLLELVELSEQFADSFDGFQLNQQWPDPRALRDYLSMCSPKRLILQIGSSATAEVEHDPKRLAEKVEAYQDMVSDVLLDPSGGFGKPFDPDIAASYIEALHHLGLGIGVAGGLGPDSLNLVQQILYDYQNISIDAQGKLQTGGVLDLSKASTYVSLASEMITENKYLKQITSMTQS